MLLINNGIDTKANNTYNELFKQAINKMDNKAIEIYKKNGYISNKDKTKLKQDFLNQLAYINTNIKKINDN